MTRSRELAELATAYDSGGGFSFRNRIINGDMRIAQRGTSSTSTSAGYHTVDRIRMTGSGALFSAVAASMAQSTVAPSGFTNSFLYTATNGTTPTTNQTIAIQHRIEGNNVADLLWGSASAQPVTLSFWVRSSLTGTFGGAVRNADASRNYVFSYSIAVANTWEYKTVTVSGDTSGTWLTDTGVGIDLLFSLGAGPDALRSAGSWSSSTAQGVTGQTNVVGTSGATFYITGVQLEAGSVATPFERRPYGTELALCQRYYEKSYNQNTVPGSSTASGMIVGVTPSSTISNTSGYNIGARYAVAKRASPTVTLYARTGEEGCVSTGASTSIVLAVGSGGVFGGADTGFASAINETGGSVSITGLTVGFHFVANAEL